MSARLQIASDLSALLEESSLTISLESERPSAAAGRRSTMRRASVTRHMQTQQQMPPNYDRQATAITNPTPASPASHRSSILSSLFPLTAPASSSATAAAGSLWSAPSGQQAILGSMSARDTVASPRVSMALSGPRTARVDGAHSAQEQKELRWSDTVRTGSQAFGSEAGGSPTTAARRLKRESGVRLPKAMGAEKSDSTATTTPLSPRSAPLPPPVFAWSPHASPSPGPSPSPPASSPLSPLMRAQTYFHKRSSGTDTVGALGFIATPPPAPKPTSVRAMSLLATSDLDYVPTVARTLNLNASSPSASIQIQPTLGKFTAAAQAAAAAAAAQTELHPTSQTDAAQLIAALLEKANTTAVLAQNLAHPQTNPARSSLLSAQQQLAAFSFHPHALTSPNGSPLTSPRTGRLRAGAMIGSGAWKRATMGVREEVRGNTHARTKSSGPFGMMAPPPIALDETFTVPNSAPVQLSPKKSGAFSFANTVAQAVAQRASLTAASSTSGESSVDSSDIVSSIRVLPAPVASSISVIDRPSPTMMSRPSVAFVATTEGMSIVETIALAKQKEKEARETRWKAMAEGGIAEMAASPRGYSPSKLGSPLLAPLSIKPSSQRSSAAPSSTSPPQAAFPSEHYLLTPSEPLDLHRVVTDDVATPAIQTHTARSVGFAAGVGRRDRDADSSSRLNHRRAAAVERILGDDALGATSEGDQTAANEDDGDDEDRDEEERPKTAASNISPPSLSKRGTLSHEAAELLKRASGTFNPLLLLDPLTGLPIDRSKKHASAVYMGMLPDPTSIAARSTSPTSPRRMTMDLEAAHHLLNSLSPLHSVAVTTGGQTNSDGSGQINSLVRGERVELKALFKAPTLMQQAKVIQAAIIMKNQAAIAERRAIIKKRQAEADALERELEAQAAHHSAAEREKRIAEHRAKIEAYRARQGASMSATRQMEEELAIMVRNADSPYEQKTNPAGAPYSPRFTRAGAKSSLNFSDFDFSGAGMAWGKDQLGSHLRERERKPTDSTSPEPQEDLAPKVHPTGFGTGSEQDNNGAHHPLMNPTHVNFFSHLNPNSTNYNSHLNPNHENYNPLNNSAHPDHDPTFNNPRHPLFNPFYRRPKHASAEFIKSTQHLHGGDVQHPAHPLHPLYSPHADISAPEFAAARSVLSSPANHDTLLTPNGSMHRWAGAADHRPGHARGRSSVKATSAFLFDGPPSSGRAPSTLRAGSISGAGPSSPRGTFGAAPSHRTGGQTAAEKRAAMIYEKELRDGERKKWQEAYQKGKAEAAAAAQVKAAEMQPTAHFDPRDPLKHLDLASKAVPLEVQLSRFTPQQLEAIRRETVNAALGMDVQSPDPSARVGMSKFFRETLQKALGGDEIWKLAMQMYSNPDASKGGVQDPLKGISLTSMSLKAHMALFGAGALTDSDGRPIDAFGNYLDGDLERAQAVCPFPPKNFFLADLVAKYEAEMREQLKKDHEERMRDFEDFRNVARRKWESENGSIAFADAQDQLWQKGQRAVAGAAFLGTAVKNQWGVD